ncbi:IQ motif and ankyrin repeat domain-containing protein 1-like [Asterias amurensis]|uniref:IQ motif and ankyrin repeat domain-containing protein 1-like n=1 Tax=Asterias amurensis TaxID=7602 RepID=UPI003AB237D3
MPPKKPASPAVKKPASKAATTKSPTKKPTTTAAASKKPGAAVKKLVAKPETKPEPKPEAEPVAQGITIALAALTQEVLAKTAAYRETNRWPFVYDVSGNSATFLQYRDCNMIQAMNPDSLSPETIRMALLGGLRYGKPVVVNLGDCDLFDACVKKFDLVQKGLMGDILSKEILKEEKYISLVKESDGSEYDAIRFLSEIENFTFILLSKIGPPESLKKQVFVVEIS